jgi:hypothetical protein
VSGQKGLIDLNTDGVKNSISPIFVVGLTEIFDTPCKGLNIDSTCGISDAQQIPFTLNCDLPTLVDDDDDNESSTTTALAAWTRLDSSSNNPDSTSNK